VWMLSQVLGVASGFAAAFLWPAYVPAHKRGAYNGFRQSLTSLINVVAPLMLAGIYQAGTSEALHGDAALNGSVALHLNGSDSNGSATAGHADAQLAHQLSKIDDASIACLAVCGSVSIVAFLAYLPLPRLLRPPPPAPTAAEPAAPAPTEPSEPTDSEAPPPAARPLEYYDDISYAEWYALPIPKRVHIQAQRSKAGMGPVAFPWGLWADDRARASDFVTRAAAEFREIRELLTSWLTDDAKIAEALERRKANLESKKSGAAKERADKARADLGLWLSAYLDDAGYEGWPDSQHLYKTMLMIAFPPLTPLQHSKPLWEDASELRTTMLSFLRVLDNHIQTAEANAAGVAYEHSFELPDLPVGSLPLSPKTKRA